LPLQKTHCMKELFVLLFTLPIFSFAQEAKKMTPFALEFAPKWQRAKEYTVKVAEAMPEEFYAYRPTEEVFTFGEQMTHIIGNLRRLCSRMIKAEKNTLDYDYWVKNTNERTKQEILDELNQSFDYVAEALENINEAQLNEMVQFQIEQPRKDIFHVMRNHATHHRAQCVMYLRLKGITPPRGSWW